MSAKDFNQLEFVKANFEDYIYIESVGIFYWNNMYWEKGSENKVKSLICKQLELDVNSSDDIDLEEKDINIHLINSIYSLLTIVRGFKSEDTNINEDKSIVFKNGTYCLDTSSFRENEYDRSEYRTRIMNCKYKDTITPEFDNYLATTFKGNEDCIPLIQEALGYILFPSCKYEKSFIFYGFGSNGKSVLLNIIQDIIGEENTSYISMKDLEKSFYRSQLFNRILNISSELEKSISSTENFKKLVSGESVEAQFKFKDSFHFQNKAKLLFAMNQMPHINDLSDGLYRRLAIIPFLNKFTEENKDVNLFSKLKKEKDGIAYWAIQGLEKLNKKGDFTIPKIVSEMVEDLKSDNMPISRFIDDDIKITNDISLHIEKIEFYRLYTNWCENNGNKPLNSNNFYKQIKQQYPQISEGRTTIEGKRKRVYLGIATNLDKK